MAQEHNSCPTKLTLGEVHSKVIILEPSEEIPQQLDMLH